ncbi:MAG: amidohydrolase [Clostridia bacterium]|nr:amidohydrolase [Clostridia bacterium]
MLNPIFERYEKDLIDLARTVWENSEPSFREFVSSRVQVEYLRRMGFTVTENAAGTVTGYVAEWGSGKPVLAFLGEFDALYGLAQQADHLRPDPIPGQPMGHGCGHHLLGTGAIAGALLLRDLMQAEGLTGTLRIYGCPAEESGSGKAYMARDGLFRDCDAALTWHPSNFNMVCTGSSQSCIQCYFRFTGIPAHAASAPHLGRSALDAVELMNVGVNYLREHMEDSDRVHYAISNPGGSSPNVVQAYAESRYLVRSTTNPRCERLYERVKNIARGAALMTETKLEIVFDEGLSNTIPNFVLEEVLDAAFRETGVPEYTEEERHYAAGFKATVPVEDQLSGMPGACRDREKLEKNIRSSELCDYYIETNHSDVCEMGSTDVGDVSWVTPTCTANLNCYSYGADAHSWQWVAQGKSDIAMKGMLKAGEVLARTGLTLLRQPELLVRARDELNRRLKGDGYKCLIPEEVQPHYYD